MCVIFACVWSLQVSSLHVSKYALSWEASAAGKGLPADALKKVEIALEAINRVCKQGQANISALRESGESAMRDNALATLIEHRSVLMAQKTVLEDVEVLGSVDGKPATCSWLVGVLNKLAVSLEAANNHNKQCSGMVKGMS